MPPLSLFRRLVTQVRSSRTKASGVDAFDARSFSLSEEGVALMCLAEALLRIPDNATRDRLIAAKSLKGNWKSHLNNSPSLSSLTRGCAWGLLDYPANRPRQTTKQMSSALAV